MLEQRLEKIRQHLYSHGTTEIQHLAKLTRSSLATVRRDLILLEQQGLVTRTHGGASLSQSKGPEIVFQNREHQALKEKRLIAEHARTHLEPGNTIFLDAGTTVLQLAKALRLKPMAQTVYTNGLAVAQELLNLPHITVHLLGGQIRPENLSCVGPHAEQLLEKLWFDQLYLGTSAIRLGRGLFTNDLLEASLNQKMLERSDQRILLADASKLQQSAAHFVAPFSKITHFISTASLSKAESLGLQKQAVQVEIIHLPHKR